MARDYFINGEHMAFVKSRADSAIGSLTQLGLSEQPIRLVPDFRYLDIKVDAWGEGVPESQFMLSSVMIFMQLVHFDREVLDECMRLSMGGATTIGALPRAGARMGNNAARFAVGNNYIGLNLASPVGNKPWRFYFAHLFGSPVEFPIGNERSVVNLQWRAVPYTQDPWNGGTGALGSVIWDYTLDT